MVQKKYWTLMIFQKINHQFNAFAHFIKSVIRIIYNGDRSLDGKSLPELDVKSSKKNRLPNFLCEEKEQLLAVPKLCRAFPGNINLKLYVKQTLRLEP